MSNPTSNFGWQMPTPTDLVTDLPADFEVFGQAVDSSMADLKGGTSGQILSKATNTDMDFTWIDNQVGDITAVTADSPLTGGGTTGAISIGIQDATTSQKGAVQLTDSTSSTSATTAATPKNVKAAYDLAVAAIPASTATTAGDILFRNGSAVTRLPIGTAGQVLKVNTGATAPEWANSSGGGKVLQVVYASTDTSSTKTGTALTDTNITATITPSSATSKIMVLTTLACQMYSSGSVNQIGMGFALLRGATNIYNNTTGGGNEGWYITTSYNGYHQLSTLQTITLLDSPATTSATTYKVQIAASTASNTVKTSDNSRPSTIILMEIGA